MNNNTGLEALKSTLFELSVETDLYNFDLDQEKLLLESNTGKLSFFDKLRLKVNKASVEILKNVDINDESLKKDEKEDKGIYKDLARMRDEKIYKVMVRNNEKTFESYKKMIRSLHIYAKAIISSNDSSRAYKEFKRNLDDFSNSMDRLKEDKDYMDTEVALKKVNNLASYRAGIKDVFEDTLDIISDIRSEVGTLMSNDNISDTDREKIENLNKCATKLTVFAIKYNNYFANRYPIELC